MFFKLLLSQTNTQLYFILKELENDGWELIALRLQLELFNYMETHN